MDLTETIDYPTIENGFITRGDQNKKPTPRYYELARYLINEKGLKTIGKYNYIYNGTHYEQICDEMLGKIIIQYTHRKATPHWISNYVRIARQEAQIKRQEFESPSNALNVANGIVDVKRRILLPHKKAFNFKYITPIKYDPDAKCPNFMNFLDFIFNGDQELINVTSEIYGYCLLGGDPFLHKSIVLLGDGRNGKSTWLYVLRKLLGDDNCSSVSMGLLNKPFSAVRLDGKLANITGELPTSKLDSEVFKTAVGGEHLTASHKGRDEYGLKVNARFIFACNDMPKFGDATTGMWEKLYMLPFDRYIREDERDPGIFARLETELSGILNFALDGLAVLLERQKLPKIGAVDNLLNEYRTESDSVFDFFEAHIVDKKSAQYDKLHWKKLVKNYKIYCSIEGIQHPVSDKQFKKRFRRIVKERYSEFMYINYKRDMSGFYFTGLELREINNLTLLGK